MPVEFGRLLLAERRSLSIFDIVKNTPPSNVELAEMLARRAVAKLDKAVEIDSYPDRQDLNLGLRKIAREAGVRISLGMDSHHPERLEFIELGLAAALKARFQGTEF